MDHSIKPLHKFSFSKPLQLQQGNTLMTPVGDFFYIYICGHSVDKMTVQGLPAKTPPNNKEKHNTNLYLSINTSASCEINEYATLRLLIRILPLLFENVSIIYFKQGLPSKHLLRLICLENKVIIKLCQAPNLMPPRAKSRSCQLEIMLNELSIVIKYYVRCKF